MNGKYGRHLPSFILLFLLDGPNYGNAILTRMNGELPSQFADGPAIYRALGEMEKTGLVRSSWDASCGGPAKKYYTITGKGRKELAKAEKDIETRVQNLQFFLNRFQTFRETESGSGAEKEKT